MPCRPVRQRVQIVLQVQYLLLSVETAFVSGYTLSLVPDLHVRRVHLGLHFHAHRNGLPNRSWSAPAHIRSRSPAENVPTLDQSLPPPGRAGVLAPPSSLRLPTDSAPRSIAPH